eukprot:UN24770
MEVRNRENHIKEQQLKVADKLKEDEKKQENKNIENSKDETAEPELGPEGSYITDVEFIPTKSLPKLPALDFTETPFEDREELFYPLTIDFGNEKPIYPRIGWKKDSPTINSKVSLSLVGEYTKNTSKERFKWGQLGIDDQKSSLLVNAVQFETPLSLRLEGLEPNSLYYLKTWHHDIEGIKNRLVHIELEWRPPT